MIEDPDEDGSGEVRPLAVCVCVFTISIRLSVPLCVDPCCLRGGKGKRVSVCIAHCPNVVW